MGMPYSRNLKKGLYEARSNISDGRIARILFCIQKNEMILLHGFVKKTQTTPVHEKELARRRMKGTEDKSYCQIDHIKKLSTNRRLHLYY